ncbi:glycerate kinase [Arthrobacter sp. V4I6]|uniref:glycerate kinase n=1 Tax=unclassified Arthrobacter TaxID=235627 RepID=UPI002782B12C|nr:MULTISPECIES: glycerate kinase [unclassified Arthrobacter]MDQ0819314.1 glycerate kinase [Arthrobacter sp. V1I7]MDQ0853497.1 glycerate kinase [Arthrobacter sp. V4I6]
MSILVAPDSFKGTFTAVEVARHIAAGIRSAGGDATELPVADGGEGTFDVLVRGLDARPVDVSTVGPWGDALLAEIGLTADGTAVVELAMASGLNLRSSRDRDPVGASTYGTGVLMAEAARLGAQRILVASGGSATTDGGAGAIAAIEELGGLRGADVVVLSDVTTRFGDAARVFAAQKGADPATVDILTDRLEKQARVFLRDHGRDPRTVDRTGAAGGFSGGMWARYGAALVSGADFVLDLLDFDLHVAACSAVVVGEGRLDSQTGQGKIIAAILARCGAKRVYAVVGSMGSDLGDYAGNFDDVMVASDAAAMVTAGARLVALPARPAAMPAKPR